MIKKGYVDSFAAVNESPDSHPTWHWRTGYGEIEMRIDFVFHSAAFRSLESQVIQTPGSDHYLLLSKLELVDPDGIEENDREGPSKQ